MSKTKSKKTIRTKKEEKSLGGQIVKVLFAYFTTQFVLMIIVGLATWGILSLLGIKYAILLGVITGILSGIPNIGMFFATIAIVLVAIMDKVNFWPNSSPIIEGLVVLIIFIVLNKLVDFILAPIFLGRAVKLNPIILFFVIILGTVLLGPAGAVLAVPVLLVVRTIVKYYNK